MSIRCIYINSIRLEKKYNTVLGENENLKTNFLMKKAELNETKSKLHIFKEEYSDLEKSIEIEGDPIKNKILSEKRNTSNLQYKEKIIDLEKTIVLLKEENEWFEFNIEFKSTKLNHSKMH